MAEEKTVVAEDKKSKGPSPVTFEGPLNGVVWDPSNNKALCRFKNGIYKTSDPREIDIIRKYLGQREDDARERDKKMQEVINRNDPSKLERGF